LVGISDLFSENFTGKIVVLQSQCLKMVFEKWFSRASDLGKKRARGERNKTTKSFALSQMVNWVVFDERPSDDFKSGMAIGEWLELLKTQSQKFCTNFLVSKYP